MKFFLRGVADVSREATTTARLILELRESHRVKLKEAGLPAMAYTMLDALYEQPIATVNHFKATFGFSYASVNKFVKTFVAMNLLQEMTGNSRNRRFVYSPYLSLFPASTRDVQDNRGSTQSAITSTT